MDGRWTTAWEGKADAGSVTFCARDVQRKRDGAWRVLLPSLAPTAHQYWPSQFMRSKSPSRGEALACTPVARRPDKGRRTPQKNGPKCDSYAKRLAPRVKARQPACFRSGESNIHCCCCEHSNAPLLPVSGSDSSPSSFQPSKIACEREFCNTPNARAHEHVQACVCTNHEISKHTSAPHRATTPFEPQTLRIEPGGA